MASEYTTEPMDSLPSIAEAFGHSGEWQTLAEKNPDLADPHNIQPGMSLLIPDEWVSEMAQESTTSVATTGTTTSSEQGTEQDTSGDPANPRSRHSGSRTAE